MRVEDDNHWEPAIGALLAIIRDRASLHFV